MEKPRILFVYESKLPVTVQDGLWAAIELLRQDFVIYKVNVALDAPHETPADFILGWGAFNSKVDKMLQSVETDVPKGLCVGSSASDPIGMEKYAVLFCETEWFRAKVKDHPNTIHAFGINTDIYWKTLHTAKIWDWITVGAFSTWKRQNLLLKKPGVKMAIGEIQKDNYAESLKIISQLLTEGVAISDMVPSEVLSRIYNASRNVYIPAITQGGGERAVLEARACGIPVVVEGDNPKLMELLKSEVYDHHYYARQLKKGILSCL
jgi:glycosyltransferase involved in cell wall biosynthesis